MESVFKFHIATAVLHEVDRKSFDGSDDRHHKDELSEKTWSPIKDRYPNGTKLPSFPPKATVGQSDNIGCDVLLKLISGPEKVTGYIRSLGIKDTAIAVTDEQICTRSGIRSIRIGQPAAGIFSAAEKILH